MAYASSYIVAQQVAEDQCRVNPYLSHTPWALIIIIIIVVVVIIIFF